MKQNVSLVIASLLSILLATFHLVHDIVRGVEPNGVPYLPVALVLVVWLYATLALGERRWAYVVVLVLSLLGSGLPVIHTLAKGGRIGTASDGTAGYFFFIWTLIAVGVTSMLSVILAARGLWSLRRGRPSSPATRTCYDEVRDHGMPR